MASRNLNLLKYQEKSVQNRTAFFNEIHKSQKNIIAQSILFITIYATLVAYNVLELMAQQLYMPNLFYILLGSLCLYKFFKFCLYLHRIMLFSENYNDSENFEFLTPSDYFKKLTSYIEIIFIKRYNSLPTFSTLSKKDQMYAVLSQKLINQMSKEKKVRIAWFIIGIFFFTIGMIVPTNWSIENYMEIFQFLMVPFLIFILAVNMLLSLKFRNQTEIWLDFYMQLEQWAQSIEHIESNANINRSVYQNRNDFTKDEQSEGNFLQYCSNCGANLTSEEIFCGTCGFYSNSNKRIEL